MAQVSEVNVMDTNGNVITCINTICYPKGSNVFVHNSVFFNLIFNSTDIKNFIINNMNNNPNTIMYNNYFKLISIILMACDWKHKNKMKHSGLFYSNINFFLKITVNSKVEDKNKFIHFINFLNYISCITKDFFFNNEILEKINIFLNKNENFIPYILLKLFDNKESCEQEFLINIIILFQLKNKKNLSSKEEDKKLINSLYTDCPYKDLYAQLRSNKTDQNGERKKSIKEKIELIWEQIKDNKENKVFLILIFLIILKLNPIFTSEFFDPDFDFDFYSEGNKFLESLKFDVDDILNIKKDSITEKNNENINETSDLLEIKIKLVNNSINEIMRINNSKLQQPLISTLFKLFN